MDWLRIVLGILCVWRVTHLLNAEDGQRHLNSFRQAGVRYYTNDARTSAIIRSTCSSFMPPATVADLE